MRRKINWTAALALAVLPLSANAQTINIPEQMMMDIIGSDDLVDDGVIPRQWSAMAPSLGLDTYRFEIRYEGTNRSSTVAGDLVVLDNGQNAGDLIPGQMYSFNIRPSEVMRGIDTVAVPTGTANIEIRVFREGDPDDPETSAQRNFEFDYDFENPEAPTLTSVTPGENRIEISWEPPRNEEDADLSGYEIIYNPNIGTECRNAVGSVGAGPDEFTPENMPVTITSTSIDPENFEVTSTLISSTTRTFSVSTGLRNGVCAAVAVRAVDLAGNSGTPSNLGVTKPIPLFDFFEYHRAVGGGEDGGFCFIATAAHGSYAHPTVQVLRWFRDGVMKRSMLGTALVGTYYRLSPPIAHAVANDPVAAGVLRVVLLFVAALALLLLASPFAGLIALVYLARRRLTKVVVPVAAAAVFLLPTVADAHDVRGSGIGWGIQFKGGPYLPAIGNVTGQGTSATPNDIAFNNVFGPDAGPNPLYTLGVDIQLYEGFGQLGVGGTFGFMQFVGRAVVTVPDDGTPPERSDDTTVFNILPLTLTAFYRFDVLSDQYGIPLVPYARAGFAYHVWWVTNGVGDISRSEEGTSESVGRGGKLGVTGVLGLAFVLDWVEPSAAGRLETTTGIESTSIFAELEANHVNGFGGSGFDFSEVTWNIGVYLEF